MRRLARILVLTAIMYVGSQLVAQVLIGLGF